MNKEVAKELKSYLMRYNCFETFIYYYVQANKDRDWLTYHKNISNSKRVAEIIGNAFSWVDTKEGYDFWSRLHNNYGRSKSISSHSIR